MRFIYICLLILNMVYCNAQNNDVTQKVEGKCFDGYIFSEKYVGFNPLGDIDKFTPNESDIVKAEKILKEQIKDLNKDLLNQVGNCPVIHKKLSKYKRQYVGTKTENGDKVIWINFIWSKDKDALVKLSEEIIIVLDGCSYYWSVKVNLTTGKLFDLSINGSA